MTIYETTVSVRGQTVVPAKFQVTPGEKLAWAEAPDNPGFFWVQIIPVDPVEAFRGRRKGKNTLLKKLLEARKKDRY